MAPSPQNEVGRWRGRADDAFSIAPFPNDTGEFPRMSLSRETFPSFGTQRGLIHFVASHPAAVRNIPPATLCPVDDLLVLLGGTSLPRLLRWLCHHLPRGRKVIPWYVVLIHASFR